MSDDNLPTKPGSPVFIGGSGPGRMARLWNKLWPLDPGKRHAVLLFSGPLLILLVGAVVFFMWPNPQAAHKETGGTPAPGQSPAASQTLNPEEATDSTNQAKSDDKKTTTSSQKAKTGGTSGSSGGSGGSSGGGSGGSGGSSSSCDLPDYPTEDCTGVPSGTELQTISGDYTASTAGQVIDGKHITGDLQIRAHDVIVRNSEINGRVYNDATATNYRFTIEDSTVGPASGCSGWGNGAIGIANYTARRIRLKGFPDGFRIAGSNILIEDSFVTLCSTNPGDHSDGIQAYGAGGGTNITIRHNVIDQRAVTNGAATAPIFIPNDHAGQGNQNITVSVVDNVLAGGGFSLRLFGGLPFSAPAVTGNKIVSDSWEYGPLDVSCDKIGSWSGNATVTFNWTTGRIVSQVQALNDC